MKELYIYHNLGLGDHIICNGLVRHYSKLYDKIYLFVKDKNFENVQFMYRDLNNIDYIVGTVYYDGRDIFVSPYLHYENLLRVTYNPQPNMNFDECFYQSVNVPFEERWSEFFMLRDMDKELDVFNRFDIKENEYIFIQEDMNRGLGVDRGKINNDRNLKIISSDNDIKFFHLCYLIENANEVHVTESSFRPLIEHLNMKTDKLFLHRYARSQDLEITTKKKWINIT